MYPILLQFGSVTISSLWIFLAISLFSALLIFIKLVKKRRLKLAFIVDHSLAIFFGGILLARIFYIIQNFNLFFYEFQWSDILKVLYIWDKGLSPWGAIAGIGLTLAFFCYKEKENIGQWMDILSVSTLGALSVASIGTFLDGRNYGTETSLPWGVVIENSIYAVPIHPVQIYAVIYCAILAVFFYQLFGHKIGHKAGAISILAVFSYSILRFLEEFIRGDESIFILGLREAQIYTLLAAIGSGILFYVKIFHKKNTDVANK